jgi:hypothetical protein
MAAYNKFQDFTEQVLTIKHDFTGAGHVFKIFLTNEQPLVGDTMKADMVEITAGNGYTAGGEDTLNTLAEAAGTATVTGTKVVWTAAGGSIGPFQFVVLYNDTQTSPLDALVSWWDRGSALTLLAGETFTVKFNAGDPTGTIFTLV